MLNSQTTGTKTGSATVTSTGLPPIAISLSGSVTAGPGTTLTPIAIMDNFGIATSVAGLYDNSDATYSSILNNGSGLFVDYKDAVAVDTACVKADSQNAYGTLPSFYLEYQTGSTRIKLTNEINGANPIETIIRFPLTVASRFALVSQSFAGLRVFKFKLARGGSCP
jgi:hypothetical protein